MSKTVIGLIPLYDDDKDSYWMLPGYMKAIEECGALPIMLPLTSNEEELESAFELCDGLLLTGGHDVSPAVYNEEAKAWCGISCTLRDQMEGYLLKRSIQTDKPVFGICRGIQFINAYLGGSLYQDLENEHPSDTEHHMSPPYDKGIHKVKVLNNTKLSGIIGSGEHLVNSYHHQAVKELAPGLTISAISEDDLVEAIELPDKKFIMAVQWHPEFSYEVNASSMNLMRAFVDACVR